MGPIHGGVIVPYDDVWRYHDVPESLSTKPLHQANGTAPYAHGVEAVEVLRVSDRFYYGVWRQGTGNYFLRRLCVGDNPRDGVLLRTWTSYPKCFGGGGE